MNYNEIMQDLAQYTSLAEDISTVIEGLKDQLKIYMVQNNMETLTGIEHKASYKQVVSNRIDTAALKRSMPDIAQQFTKQTACMKFTFS